ncbi:MAG: UDP-N-acetylmuramoyl-tripeptide--D-alanyl-D-alanine ligase [Gammaproteobacteria bacterium]|nr:UDP-N-acetylmuramoyl-tripeptide--D-alanyl-D-alanine ligase [Gammaproteobacteria bacterium]
MSLWRWSDVCAAVGAPLADGPDINGVSIDSRTLASGDLFVALPGDPGQRFNVSQRSERDGHDYVGAALEAGAAGTLVSRDPDADVPRIVVGDTIDALWDLARAGRARFDGRVVAVTGSSGKTTVKTFIAHALDAFSSSGSLNNHLGVPLSLARTPADARFAVYEIGTNHPGEIAPLSRLAQPDVAVVLNVHPAHIEHFDDIAALKREKLSIADGLRRGDTLVCLDTLNASSSGRDIRVLTFGTGRDADVRLVSSDGGIAVVETPSGRVEAEVPGGGEHRAVGLAAAAGVMIALGEDPAAIRRIGPSAVPAGRGNRIRVGGITLIDDSYNANPASMAAALRALRGESGRTVAVLGEMLELGDDARRLHAEMASACREIDKVICVGDAMDILYDRLPGHRRVAFFPSPEDIDPDVIVEALRPGDVILLKGSNRVFWSRGFARVLGRRIEEVMGTGQE